jgi:hypothetical protein
MGPVVNCQIIAILSRTTASSFSVKTAGCGGGSSARVVTGSARQKLAAQIAAWVVAGVQTALDNGMGPVDRTP